MNKKNKVAFLIVLLFVFSISNVFSQVTKTEKLPLASVLKTLESRYNISFSFADKTVENRLVLQPDENLELNEALRVLEDDSTLEFQILSERFVAIIDTKSENTIIQQLDEVILTNFLTSGISKTDFGTTQLKPETLGILPGLIEPDVLHAIQALPGILSIDETVSNLNVRGGSNDQNLILWDGIKMYQSGHFFGLISAYSPYLTKNVLVSKNGTSALYGDGVSSTIDMRLDNNLSEGYSSGFGINLINIDGYIKLPITKSLELQVSARRSVTDRIETATYKQYFDRIFQDTDITVNQSDNANETFYFYDVGAKILYDISEKDKLRFNFTTIFNSLDYIEKGEATNLNDAISSGITQRNIASGFNYSRQWTDAFSSDLQVYLSNYKLIGTNQDIINNQRLFQENEVLDYGIKLKTDYSLNSNFNWVNGYQYSEVAITNTQDINNPQSRSEIKDVLSSHSGISEITYASKNKNTNIKAGIRGNYFNAFNTFLFEPRLSFNHRFLDHFKVEVLGEYKSQTTSQVIARQSDFLGIENRRWELANNTTIPIIKSKQISLGLYFNKNKLLLSIEGYLKNVDGITTRSQDFQNDFQFINAIGSYKVKGIDFLINKQLPNVSTWLSYSYSENDYTFSTLNNGNPFPSNIDVRHKATFASTYTINKLKIALGVNWRSGKPITEPVNDTPIFDNTINYEFPNSSNLKDYFRTDFSTTYNFNLDEKIKAKVGLSIWNILNNKNTLNRYYTIDDNGDVATIENASLGITPNMSFRLNF